MELIEFRDKIHLITSDQELAQVTPELLTASKFGFDTETRPSFKKGEVYKVALLQLATNDTAFVIRLHRITQFQVLKSVFENPNVLKVGVAIRDDLKALQKLFPFSNQNFVELQDLAKKKNLQNFGLKGMTEEVLKARLSKAAKTTNWEAPVLTEKQITYAATDAWIGLKIYESLMLRP